MSVFRFRVRKMSISDIVVVILISWEGGAIDVITTVTVIVTGLIVTYCVRIVVEYAVGNVDGKVIVIVMCGVLDATFWAVLNGLGVEVVLVLADDVKVEDEDVGTMTLISVLE